MVREIGKNSQRVGSQNFRPLFRKVLENSITYTEFSKIRHFLTLPEGSKLTALFPPIPAVWAVVSTARNDFPAGGFDGLIVASQLLKIGLDILGSNHLATFGKRLQECFDFVLEVVVGHDALCDISSLDKLFYNIQAWGKGGN